MNHQQWNELLQRHVSQGNVDQLPKDANKLQSYLDDLAKKFARKILVKMLF
jgi:hypothetical protein